MAKAKKRYHPRLGSNRIRIFLIKNGTMKTQKTEYVFLGKTFLSIQRAEQKKSELEKKGYKLVNANSKKLTYKL